MTRSIPDPLHMQLQGASIGEPGELSGLLVWEENPSRRLARRVCQVKYIDTGCSSYRRSHHIHGVKVPVRVSAKQRQFLHQTPSVRVEKKCTTSTCPRHSNHLSESWSMIGKIMDNLKHIPTMGHVVREYTNRNYPHRKEETTQGDTSSRSG